MFIEEHYNLSRRKKKLTIFLMLIFLVLTVFTSFFIGAYYLSPGVVLDLLIKKITSSDLSGVEHAILFDIRIPRIVLAVLVGAGLSISSASFQATFKNPLVSEYILGVSAGAAFGASISIAFLGPKFPLQPMAFLGGILAVLITYFIARTKGEIPVISLVLSGVITTAMFTAGNYVIRYIVEPEKLQVIVIWLMGSFSAASWKDVAQVAPFILTGSFILFLMRWRFNVLSMGDEEAKALGLDVEKLKMLFIGISTLITASATSVVGIIGWLGFVMPHIARMLLGSDNRLVLPASAMLGATLLLIADNVVRMAKGIELPVGILTTLLGAPFFIYLIKKIKGGGWE